MSRIDPQCPVCIMSCDPKLTLNPKLQDDAVSTIFQWLYSRMEDVHSGEYSEPPPVLPATPLAGPAADSDGGGGGGSSEGGNGSGAGGGGSDALPAEESVVPKDGSS
jgi:hypothetical protein